MKNLANCSPSEFIAQTVKIKRVASKWLKEIAWAEIIKQNKKEYEVAESDATAKERAEFIKKNAEIQKENRMDKFSKLFDNAFEKYPEDTLAVLALSCFVEPENVDDHPMSDYFDCLTEMMCNKAVTNFFTCLVTLSKAI